jgi:hypothetical protein
VNGVDPLGVKKNSFGQCRLARVDVGADSDISDFLDVAFHRAFPFASKNKKSLIWMSYTRWGILHKQVFQ